MEVLAQYDEAAKKHREAVIALGLEKYHLADLEGDMKLEEARFLLSNCGPMGVVTGKNEAERKAQLFVALHEMNAPYTRMMEDHRVTTQSVFVLDGEVESLTNTMARDKLLMRYLIATARGGE